ncbi:hypothetical protein [Bdellovibrio svalbardensis]|uniref:DUF4835 family protein n=1 Tax=Bdellovibrio svalbardensis TaxID=2972972 RepID=A0ABT6DM17_9BACT|nr:hypothetical protein [Bdellovibrio svalbardensis]MDG0817843.1 hypothetical protein [Bdellovibrio svalbardensis]
MKWLVVLLFSLNFIEARAAIYDDGQDTHGGSPIIAEVMKVRDDLYIQAMNIPDFVLSGYPNLKDKLTSAVANAELRLEEELYWKGQRVLAINHPQASPPFIQINGPYWQESREDINLYKVVIHEYLFIAGWDDTTYVHSDKLIEMINIARVANPWYFIDYGINNKAVSFTNMVQIKEWLAKHRFEYQDFAASSLFRLTTSLSRIEDDRVKKGLFEGLLEMLTPKYYCSIHVSGVISELQRTSNTPLSRELLQLMNKKFKLDLAANSPVQCR